MFYVGYFIGVITSGLLLSFPLYLVRKSLLAEAVENNGITMPNFRRRTKRVPKSISEEDLWKREQKIAPRDPSVQAP